MKSKLFFEYREGNGNDGNYYRGSFKAKDLEQANNIVRRQFMDLKKYWRTKLVVDWGDNYIYYHIPCNDEFGYSEFTAELREITMEDFKHNMACRSY